MLQGTEHAPRPAPARASQRLGEGEGVFAMRIGGIGQLTQQAVPPAPAPAPVSYYDLSEAQDATFKAALRTSAKSRDTSFATRFDHVWCKGQFNAKGPKGGQYFVGRCVMGVKKHQQVKGILRISNERFLALQAGGVVDGWFRPDGSKDSVLIGELSGYRAT
jgi:hypothetical protein